MTTSGGNPVRPPQANRVVASLSPPTSRPGGRSPETRFRLWQLTVLATLVGSAVWLVGLSWSGPEGWVTRLAATASILGLLAIVGLLRTTPPDAIVLPRRRSHRIIASATFVLVAALALQATWVKIENGVLLSAFLEPGLPAVGILVNLTLLFALLSRLGRSPWWAAVAVWSPTFLHGSLVHPFEGVGVTALLVFLQLLSRLIGRAPRSDRGATDLVGEVVPAAASVVLLVVTIAMLGIGSPLQALCVVALPPAVLTPGGSAGGWMLVLSLLATWLPGDGLFTGPARSWLFAAMLGLWAAAGCRRRSARVRHSISA